MRTRKTAETRKTEIVEAALRLADEIGPDRLTTEAIAEAVGLTQPGLFRHFPKKQEIWEAVAKSIGERMQGRWDRVRQGAASPEDQLRALVAAQLGLIQSTPAITAILFSRELHAENEGLRLVFLTLMQRFHGLLVERMEAARMSGRFRADLDPRDAAFLVLGLVQGLAVRWSLSRARFDILEEGRRLLDLLLSGFVGPTPSGPRKDPS